MKYRFLLLSTLFVSATALAQGPKKVTTAPDTYKPLRVADAPVHSNEGSSSQLTEGLGQAFFFSDFNDSTAQWSNVSFNSSGAVWEWRGPSTSPNVGTGSQGAYASGDPIESPSASNGFMIFDSDYYDNGGTQGNFGGGPFPEPHNAGITSPDIDCSSETNIVLTFWSFFRSFDANGYVIVTNDNFVTQDTVWSGYDEYGINVASPVDDFIKVNISDIAGGESTVKVRFLFESRGVRNPSGYYFWMVDDIAVRRAADFDLAVTETFFRGAGVSDYSARYINFYNQLPASQAAAAELNMGAAVFNLSNSSMTGSVVSTDVSGAGTFSGTSNAATYSTFGDEEVATVTAPFTPSAVGNYIVDFSVAADSTDDYPEDNAQQKEFNVTERTFSWDDGAADGAISWGNNVGDQSMYRLIEFFADDTISAIEFGIWSTSTFASDDGAVVEVGIWEVDYEIDGSTGDTNNYNLGQSLFPPIFRVMTADEYTDGSNDDRIRVALDEPFAVPAGEYLVGYKRSSGSIRTVTSDLPWTPLTAWVDVDSDGSIDGWIDDNPVIHVETWSSDVCAGSNIVVDADISCNLGDFTADIDASVFNGEEPYIYSWNTGSEDEDITVDTEGTYTLSVIDANYCEGEASFDVFNGDIFCNLAVNDLNGASFGFAVLPNPNNGVFNVAFEAAQAESVKMEIQSLKGDVVFSEAMNISSGMTKSIDLNGLAAGVYVMKVSNESGTSIEKIIIE